MLREAFQIRDQIQNEAILKDWLQGLREKAEEYRGTEIAEWTMQDYERFYRDGNRLAFEEKYFDRRGRLTTYALMVFVYRDKDFLPLLEEVIEKICDEPTWVLPAHLPEGSTEGRTFIDLFAAETGSALSEIKYLLADVLSDAIKARMHEEVRERVVEPYVNHGSEFWWFTITTNWSAVCSGCAALSCMYDGTAEEAERAIELAGESMKYFLSGFSEEGVCMEGYSYWTYGFGSFLTHADAAYKFTDGKVNYFADERVHQIARFMNGGILRTGTPVAFADASAKEGVSLAYAYYLSAKYSDIGLADGGWAEYADDVCYRWVRLVRTFVWVPYYKNQAHEETKQQGVSYYPDAGWYIKKTPSYILCAKGGHNAEPHNHNDVASFYIDDYSKQVLNDLGSGEYTRDYFAEKRYEFFVCGSQGHNVPIIDGKLQEPGADRKATILEVSDNVLRMEAAKAYAMDELKSFVRCLEMTDDEIMLTDHFEGEIHEIRERFITSEAVVVTDTGCKIGKVTLDAGFRPEIGTVVYAAHDGAYREVKTSDFVLDEKEFQMRICFEE